MNAAVHSCVLSQGHFAAVCLRLLSKALTGGWVCQYRLGPEWVTWVMNKEYKSRAVDLCFFFTCWTSEWSPKGGKVKWDSESPEKVMGN